MPLPASRTTCPAFGGAGHGCFFGNSARIGPDEAALRAGLPLAVRWCVRLAGRPVGSACEHRFATELRA